MEVPRRATDTVIVSNNERFIRTTYNGISIIVREKDGYVNGSSLTKGLNPKKEFYRIKEHGGWSEFLDEMTLHLAPRESESQGKPLQYVLNAGFTNKENVLRGTYIHPKLVNYAAIWASPKYAVYVTEIMDEINMRGRLKQISDEENMKETLKVLQDENTKLRDELKLKDDVIVTQTIKTQKDETVIEEQTELIHDQAVRSSINTRPLTIYRDDGDKIKMSADATRPFNRFIIRYTLPASMNVRMEITKALKLKMSDIPIGDLHRVISWCDALKPKSRTVGIDYIL